MLEIFATVSKKFQSKGVFVSMPFLLVIFLLESNKTNVRRTTKKSMFEFKVVTNHVKFSLALLSCRLYITFGYSISKVEKFSFQYTIQHEVIGSAKQLPSSCQKEFTKGTSIISSGQFFIILNFAVRNFLAVRVLFKI